MIRKITLVLVFSILAVSAFAFDRADFNSSLKDLAEGIAQTAYTLSEKADSSEREAYEAAVARAEKSERRIREILNQLETKADFDAAKEELKKFAAVDKTNAHTAAFVEKLLVQRINFVTANNFADTNEVKMTTELKMAAAPEMVLNRRQRRMVMIDTPIVEAVISLEDTKNARRVNNLKAIFSRHECRILSENKEDGGDNEVTNFYFSGKKYVLDALLGHFGGDVVNNDLKAIVKITSGGFWSGKKSVTINVAANGNNGVMGNLSWFKSTIEKDPFKYFANSGDMSKLESIGAYENIAGENKLHLKNAIMEIWVTAKNGTTRNAIYKNSIEFGDVYVNGR
jgi:hypothetical protein